MSFTTFKLDNLDRRPGLAPIAPAAHRSAPSKPDSDAVPLLASRHAASDLPVKESPPSIHYTASSHMENAKLSYSQPQGTFPTAPLRHSKRRATRSNRNTACQGCQKHKVRCERDFGKFDNKCRRCLRLNTDCAPAPGKSQKAEFSTTLSHPKDEGRALLHTEANENQQEAPVMDAWLNAGSSKAFYEGLTGASSVPQLPACVDRKQIDLKINFLLNWDTAELVFNRYMDTFVPTCPMVVFPPGTTADAARKNKPLLFLSILSVASAPYCTVPKQKELTNETRRFLAESTVHQGEKSLELVQALQVSSLWYRAPDHYNQGNLYQLVQMATSLAMDLGLNKPHVLKVYGQELGDWGRAEAHRAWLGCFFLSASLSLILRRPKIVGWNAQMDDQLAEFRLIGAIPSDEFFCELVMMERCSHNIDEALLLTDGDRNLSLRDPETANKIHCFQSQLDSSPLSQVSGLQHSLVSFGNRANSLYAHETALHVNHNIDEFGAPFTVKSLKSCGIASAQSLDASHLSMLHTCIAASRGLLDIFLSTPFATILALPAYLYAGRVIYAVILLIKTHGAISMPATGIGQFFRPEELGVEQYLERLVVLSNQMMKADECNALSRALLVIGNLNDWLHTNKLERRRASNGAGKKRPFSFDTEMHPNSAPLLPLKPGYTSTTTTGLKAPLGQPDVTDQQLDHVNISSTPPQTLYTQNTAENPFDLQEGSTTLFDDSIWDEILNQSMFI